MVERRRFGCLLGLGAIAAVACGTKAGTDDPSAGGDAGAAVDAPCARPTDCPSTVCTAAGVCAAPSATDGAKNGDETDVDCGGSGPKCDVQKRCASSGDCATGVCKDVKSGLQCQPPAPDDGVKNGDETDTDCGGARSPKCADGKACGARLNCASDVCVGAACAAAACVDTTKNGTETDIDCGGPGCPRCAPGLACKGVDDCDSGVCVGLKCQAPSPTDHVKNGTETDIDCGGSAPKCATGKSCAVHADCTTDGCDYNGKCALRKSCTAHYGGDTCGAGGAGGAGPAAWESCCATEPAGNGGPALDKYKITSGRMRVFLERVNGDVRKAVREARAAGKVPPIPNDPAHTVLDPLWDLYLPTSLTGCDQNGTCDTHPDGAGGIDVEVTDHFWRDATDFKGIYTSAWRHVGGSIWPKQNQTSQGCRVASPGTHSYWMDKATQSTYFGDIESDYSQAEYDVKGLNCVPYLLSQAFCVWDGGRLETAAEWLAAIGPTAYPWGAAPTAKGQGSGTYFAFRFPDATDASLGLPAAQSIERGNYLYSYEYPHLGERSDFIVFINAPGRLPKGNGPWGHADLAYTMFENTSNVVWKADAKAATSSWTNNGSWEVHNYSKSSFGGESLFDKYGKMGGRCVYP